MGFFCYCDNFFRPYDPLTIQGALYGQRRCYINKHTAAKAAKMTDEEKATIVERVFSVNPLTHDVFNGGELTWKQKKRVKQENQVAKVHFGLVFGQVPTSLSEFSPVVPKDGQDFVSEDEKFPWVLPDEIRKTHNNIGLMKKMFHCKNGCRYHVTPKTQWTSKCIMCYKRHNYPGRPYGGQSWLTPLEIQFLSDLCDIANDDRLHHPCAAEYAQVILDVFVHKTKPIPKPHFQWQRETVNKTFYK